MFGFTGKQIKTHKYELTHFSQNGKNYKLAIIPEFTVCFCCIISNKSLYSTNILKITCPAIFLIILVFEQIPVYSLRPIEYHLAM